MEAILKQSKGNRARNQRATGNCSGKRLCTEYVPPMFVICESALSIMTRLKSNTRNRMTDETWLRLPTTEIKADIDFITKTKKQKNALLFCWFVVYLFLAKKALFWVANKQKNLKLSKNKKLRWACSTD